MAKKIPNEIEFLKASVKGDTVAFETIVKKYQSFICAITFSATGDVEKSEELAQEAFISAWKGLAQLKDLSKFRSWLGSIARNVIRNSFRSQKRDLISKSASMDQIEDVGIKDSGPVETAITKERQAVVRQALQQIPAKYREPLVLFYRQQQSVKEVAEQLQLSEGVAKQRLSRGRKLLKEQVAAMVETTISRTGPKKAFTTAVIASVTGMVIKGSAVGTAGVVAAASETPATAGLTTVMSGVTAKIIAAAAVAAIGVGAVVTYKQITKPSPGPELSQAGIIVQEQGDEQEKIPEEVIEQPGDETTDLLTIDKTQDGLETEETGVKSAEPVSTRDTEFKFAPKGILSGIITDVENGEPVTDAKMYATHIHGGEIYESKTDPNGFYWFKDVEQDGDYRIQIFSKKYVGIHYRDKVIIHLGKESQAVKHFKLQRACMIEVKVVNEQGEPLPGTRFHNTLIADKEKREIEDWIHPQKTDANGMIILGGFKPKETPYLIVAGHTVRGDLVQGKGMRYYETHRDYAPGKLVIMLTDPDIVEYREIVLKKGNSVAGHIEYLDGEPATDLKISACPKWWHSNYLPKGYPVGANGYFALEHILPGTYSIQASVPFSDGSSRSVSLGYREFPLEDGELLELRFPERSTQSLASISGTVKWLGEGEASYVHISARTPYGQSFTSLARNGEGKLEKHFLIERLEPGIYTLKFTGEDIEDTTIGNIRAPSEGLIVEIPIKQQTILRGKVLDKYDGNPVTKFEVGLNNNWVQFEDPEGEFELALKSNECKRVAVRVDRYATKLSEEICPDANEPTIIELGIGGAIEGKVVDEKGNPIEDAKISYRYSRSRGEKPDDKYITATDANGLFVIEDVPETWEWFELHHPNYAPEVKQIEIEGDYITYAEIVLKKGCTVEGYVYNSRGKPVPDTTLYFLDETSYSNWEGNRGRLGSITTDSNGFYRITGMPEKLCFGFRHEPDKQLGVVHTSILPKNGKTAHLDFGGQWYAAGRLLKEGKPETNIKVMLRGDIAGYETAFTAHALTDAEGRFAFWGIPSGSRFMYWSIPGMHGWNQWVEIGRFNFESGIDLDMGDFEVQLAEVAIRITAENPNESLNQLDVYVQNYDEKIYYGRRVGQLSPRTEQNAPYIFSNVAPGIYEAIARRSGYPTIHKVFEIEQGRKKCNVDLWIPAGSASLSGKIIPIDHKELQIPLMLRSINQEITMGFQPKADGSYKISNLPAGDYIIGRASVALSRQSKIEEVSLKSGENKNFDIEVDSIGRKYGGYLVVLIVTEEGLPLAGAKAWLEKGGKIIDPHFDSDKSKSFAGDTGEYTLYTECPGYKNIQQKVRIKSKEGLNTQEILKPVVLTMSK